MIQRRHTVLPLAAAKGSKGFGPAKQPKAPRSSPVQEDAPTGRKGKGKSVAAPRPPLPAGVADAAVAQFDELEAAKKRAAEEAEFNARLSLIKAEAAQKVAAGALPSAGASGAASPPARAVFDAPKEGEADIYANPPSLMSTLGAQLQSDINDPALRDAKIGPGQLGLAGGAVLFGLVFVLVSGGDFAPTNRYKGLRPARPPPDPIEMSRLARQAEGFEAALAANPDDTESLEAAAVTYARMQDFGRAAQLLDQLTAAHPRDVEAWRLLGESRLLNADAAKSVAAYERAIALAPDDQKITTGLVDAYVANSQQAKAIAYLTSLRDRLMAAAAPAASTSSGGGASSSSSGGGGEDAAVTAAAMPDAAGEASSSSSSGGDQGGAAGGAASSSGRAQADVISVQLLLGKSYAAWRGHDQDALAAYDTLIGAFPSDFRGYLAKGMFLRERGRQGDAERMFLQARLYAPDSMQAFVAARAGEQPAMEPLPDNGLE